MIASLIAARDLSDKKNLLRLTGSDGQGDGEGKGIV
jgi:hypothetical protein